MQKLAINGYTAIISYDEEIELFRGEFIDLNGGADFYADTVQALQQEAEISLNTFLAVCQEKGIAPIKHHFGKLHTDIDPLLHAQLEITANRQGISIDEFVGRAIKNELLAVV